MKINMVIKITKQSSGTETRNNVRYKANRYKEHRL